MKDFATFLMGAVVGAVMGAAAGLLMAPMRGEELRGEIEAQVNSTVSDVKTEFNKSLEDMRTKLDERVDTLQQKGSQIEQRAKEATRSAV